MPWHEVWDNVTHNLFKPLLLFFCLGFLIPILKVRFEFPQPVFQGLTMYLLLAIGWHGGEQLAAIKPTNLGAIAGFMVVGLVLNFLIGGVAYLLLSLMGGLRRVDQAAVAAYYASDSAGTFATCVAVLTGLGIAFNGYMPVMLAVMVIPGCLLAMYLVARLRSRGMDPAGNMPDEPDYSPPVPVGPGAATRPATGVSLNPVVPQHSWPDLERQWSKVRVLKEVLVNPGLCLLIGALIIGFVSGLQGQNVIHDHDTFFVSAFQGALCLFLLEMGMTASRRLQDLRSAGFGFILFGLLAPNIFAVLGIIVAHGYAYFTNTEFKPGTYVLFAVLCGGAS